MNQGWIFEGDHDTVKYEQDVVQILRDCAPNFGVDFSGRSNDDILQAAFELDICCWTDWDDDCDTDDDDVLYTHDGRVLHTQRDREDYLRGLPYTNPERVTCAMIHDGYKAVVTSGCDDVVMWNGKQRVLVEALMKDLSDGCFMEVRQGGDYWDDWLSEYWENIQKAGTKRFNAIITNRSKYLFDVPNEACFGPLQKETQAKHLERKRQGKAEETNGN